jgi:predicted nucleotidyltransferase
MVDKKILDLISNYLDLLKSEGIRIEKAILFGSYAKGNATESSDIDLLLISPLFDIDRKKYLYKVWSATKISDYRIEPILMGKDKQDESLIADIAKSEGIEIPI